MVEAATLALVVLIVAFVFRSLIAPFLILGAAGATFVVDQRLLGWFAGHSGLGVPGDIEPLVVALLLGVVTDYSIFFLSAFRKRLAAGEPPRVASRRAVAETAPIVLVAGLTVAAGCAALSVAPTRLFRSFGPGLAITVAVAAVTCVTMVPAAMTILGRFAFWPSRPQGLEADTEGTLGPTPIAPRRPGLEAARCHRAGLACLAVMVIAALPVARLRLSLSFTRPLPASAEARQGAAALSRSFPPGIVNPTEILLGGFGRHQPAQRDRQAAGELERQPGVVTVLGPAQNPFQQASSVFFSQDDRPRRPRAGQRSLGATAVDDLRRSRIAARNLCATPGYRVCSCPTPATPRSRPTSRGSPCATW